MPRAKRPVYSLGGGHCCQQARFWARSYLVARDAMVELEASHELMRKYRLITKQNLKMSTDITEESRMGQRNDRLPWFWRVEGGEDKQGENGMMNECE
jgi:hypothetical protein